MPCDLCQAQLSARVRTEKRTALFSPAILAIDELLLKLDQLALNPIGARQTDTKKKDNIGIGTKRGKLP